MSVLSYNEITPKKIIVFNNEPHTVLSSHVFRKQQRKPVNITKLKGMVSGRMVEQTFHQNDTAEEADVSSRPIHYIYENRGEYWFHTPGKPSERFSLAHDILGEEMKFVKENSELEAVVYDEAIIGVKIPIKVELTIKEAAPAVKGNTSSGATKEVVLETGATIQVPMFINEGDVVRVNTETGTYAERVEKA